MKRKVGVLLLVLASSCYAEHFYCLNCKDGEDSSCANGTDLTLKFCEGVNAQCYTVGFADTKEVEKGCWIPPEDSDETDYCTFQGLKEPDICRVCQEVHCNICPLVF